MGNLMRLAWTIQWIHSWKSLQLPLFSGRQFWFKESEAPVVMGFWGGAKCWEPVDCLFWELAYPSHLPMSLTAVPLFGERGQCQDWVSLASSSPKSSLTSPFRTLRKKISWISTISPKERSASSFTAIMKAPPLSFSLSPTLAGSLQPPLRQGSPLPSPRRGAQPKARTTT